MYLNTLVIFGKASEKHEKKSRKEWIKIISVHHWQRPSFSLFSFYTRLVEYPHKVFKDWELHGDIGNWDSSFLFMKIKFLFL